MPGIWQKLPDLSRKGQPPASLPGQSLPPSALPTLAGLFLTLLAFLWQSDAFAAPPANHPDARVCSDEAARVERLYQLPRDLLGAIALTETGRMDNAGDKIAWPWTINVAGEGYRFATREAAIAAVKLHQEAGIKSIDVGCFQVNLKWHPNAFISVEQAFDPRKGGEYAATFLRQLRKELGGWDRAARAWHSRDRDKGRNYGKLVSQNRKLIRKQRQAKAGATRRAAKLNRPGLEESRRIARNSFLRHQFRKANLHQTANRKSRRRCLRKAAMVMCMQA